MLEAPLLRSGYQFCIFMPFKTLQCRICGIVVMANFLREHIDYVHGPKAEPVRTNKRAKEGTKASANTKASVPKQKSGLNSNSYAGFKTKQKNNSKKVFRFPCVPIASRKGINHPRVSLKLRSKRGGKGGPVCALCGASISNGRMLEHKHLVHGERMVVPSPTRYFYYRKSPAWIRFVQGGLPSLGKRSR